MWFLPDSELFRRANLSSSRNATQVTLFSFPRRFAPQRLEFDWLTRIGFINQAVSSVGPSSDIPRALSFFGRNNYEITSCLGRDKKNGQNTRTRAKLSGRHATRGERRITRASRVPESRAFACFPRSFVLEMRDYLPAIFFNFIYLFSIGFLWSASMGIKIKNNCHVTRRFYSRRKHNSAYFTEIKTLTKTQSATWCIANLFLRISMLFLSCKPLLPTAVSGAFARMPAFTGSLAFWSKSRQF